MGVGSRIRQERQKQGLELRELSKLSGVPERTLADIEREISNPRTDSLKRLIIALGCSADQVIFDDEEMMDGTDLAILMRELAKVKGQTRETAKEVLKALLIQARMKELEDKKNTENEP
ncbi:helix-turn-helix domain-containing protein [Terasakiella sp.]|jgi:transcriptional regulator with XRE-family HTH domain|uniref:helix-turn-helix domain-containing protein n=1 Tax=Terasakiella sp. TaxID=2034861 RepID=UPI003AA9D360